MRESETVNRMKPHVSRNGPDLENAFIHVDIAAQVVKPSMTEYMARHNCSNGGSRLNEGKAR